EYITTIYTVGWDEQPGSRIASFAAMGVGGTFNQNEMGNNNGMAISFRFPAPAASITIDVDPYTDSIWHYYGFSNKEVVPVPEPGTIVMLVIGAVGLAVYGWRRRRKTA
ncbi:MAG: PEP-CTERM sorting domain-containing protein, partial [Candidatus Nealsonbacteria bacterium]|nr:PEP-CTERM sorting domain-containing protein [Candidatus Nealsonbacteria bacterium]